MIEGAQDRAAAPARIVLDVHAHLIPLRSEGIAGLEGVAWSERGRLVVDGSELPKRELYEPAALLHWMDANHVAAAWVSIPPTLYRPELDAAAAAQWSRAVNAALRTLTQSSGGRLAPLLHLPMQHPEVAVAIAVEATQAGQRRFAMPANAGRSTRLLSDPEYGALWKTLDRSHAFLFVHPSRGCDPRLDRFSLPNLLGGPCETALAAAHLAMSGILERHPAMTVCLAHGGGATAAVTGRLARGQDTGRPGAYGGGEKVRQALRRLCVDCITHDPAALELAAATFGEDRVLFGSDWPFDMGLPHPHQALGDVREALRDRILVDNPERLLAQAGVHDTAGDPAA